MIDCQGGQHCGRRERKQERTSISFFNRFTFRIANEILYTASWFKQLDPANCSNGAWIKVNGVLSSIPQKNQHGKTIKKMTPHHATHS
jgi:hypothetical protein